jgi:hypothetical protein
VLGAAVARTATAVPAADVETLDSTVVTVVDCRVAKEVAPPPSSVVVWLAAKAIVTSTKLPNDAPVMTIWPPARGRSDGSTLPIDIAAAASGGGGVGSGLCVGDGVGLGVGEKLGKGKGGGIDVVFGSSGAVEATGDAV